MRDHVFMQLMRLLPKSAVSTMVGMATRAPVPPRAHQAAMRLFAKQYGVNVDEAEGAFADFQNFGEFFTRKLKPGVRVIDATPEAIVSPCDGAISQVGTIDHGACVQAKGISFPVDKLLGDAREAMRFDGGNFVTIYLSPRDYHRFHSPLDGSIAGYTYLPGEFWPVNRASVRLKDALFAINERLVTYLDTSLGRVAYVAVGATCVSRIRAAFDDVVTHTGGAEKHHWYERPMPIKKGDEIGMFEMGSTVIMLFERRQMTWVPSLQAESVVRVGERIGTVQPQK